MRSDISTRLTLKQNDKKCRNPFPRPRRQERQAFYLPCHSLNSVSPSAKICQLTAPCQYAMLCVTVLLSNMRSDVSTSLTLKQNGKSATTSFLDQGGRRGKQDKESVKLFPQAYFAYVEETILLTTPYCAAYRDAAYNSNSSPQPQSCPPGATARKYFRIPAPLP